MVKLLHSCILLICLCLFFLIDYFFPSKCSWFLTIAFIMKPRHKYVLVFFYRHLNFSWKRMLLLHQWIWPGGDQGQVSPETWGLQMMWPAHFCSLTVVAVLPVCLTQRYCGNSHSRLSMFSSSPFPSVLPSGMDSQGLQGGDLSNASSTIRLTEHESTDS